MNFTDRTIKNTLAAALLSFISLITPASAQEKGNKVIHINAQEARVLLGEESDIQVLDVRTRPEFDNGHISGAKQINYLSTSFSENLSALDKQAPYIVHCKSGNRSSKAVEIMQREGFTNIYHLDGGYKAWKALPNQNESHTD